MNLLQARRGRTQIMAMGLFFFWTLTLSAQTSDSPPLDSVSFQLLTKRMPDDLKQRFRESVAKDPALRRAIFGQLPTARPSAVKMAAANTDLNGDGITDASDVQLAINQARGLSPCSTGDINKDGSCNVTDIQLVVIKALGR